MARCSSCVLGAVVAGRTDAQVVGWRWRVVEYSQKNKAENKAAAQVVGQRKARCRWLLPYTSIVSETVDQPKNWV